MQTPQWPWQKTVVKPQKVTWWPGVFIHRAHGGEHWEWSWQPDARGKLSFHAKKQAKRIPPPVQLQGGS